MVAGEVSSTKATIHYQHPLPRHIVTVFSGRLSELEVAFLVVLASTAWLSKTRG
jgi:hypothetical protein